MFGFGKQKKEREYTPMQAAFLAALKDPANKGSILACKRIAGYSDKTPTAEVMHSLRDEIRELAKDILTVHSVQAAFSLIGALDEVHAVKPGVKEATTNAERILDRVGIGKTETVNIDNAPGRIAILPARKKDDEVSVPA